MSIFYKFKLFVIGLVCSLGLLGTQVFAVSNGVSQGYKTEDKSVGAGNAVSLRSDSAGEKFVDLSDDENSSKFVGIITTIDDSLVSLTDQSSNVLVTTSGEVSAYVSDINSVPKSGDLIAISPIKGVLMKSSGDDTSLVVGVALEDFDSATATSKQVIDSQGAGRVVNISKQRIEITRDIVSRSQNQSPKSFIVLIGESITGKEVSSTQVIASLVVLFMVLILEGSIIYGAIHSTIGALGRNPLSRRAVFKQLLQVSWLALIVLIFGLGAIYLLLFI